MAWGPLLNSQWVSRNDLQDAVTTGVFTLKVGQTIPAGNNWVTRSEVETWINATVSSGTSSQWPQKSWIIATTCPGGGISAFETSEIFYSENFNDFPDCFYFNTSNSRYYLEPAFTNLATGFVLNTSNTSIDRVNAGVGSTYIGWLPGDGPLTYSSFDYLGDVACNFGYNGSPGNVNSFPPSFLSYMRKNITYDFSVEVAGAPLGTTSEFAIVFWTGDPNDSGMTHVKKFTSSYYVAIQGQTYNFSVTTDNTWTDVMGVGVIGKTGVYCNAEDFAFYISYTIA